MIQDHDADRRDAASDPTLRRVFIREPGWRVGQKVGSEKVFCYQITPGEDYHHRLSDGEVFVYHGEERLCLPCAERRKLVVFEPRMLREKMTADIVTPTSESEYDVAE